MKFFKMNIYVNKCDSQNIFIAWKISKRTNNNSKCNANTNLLILYIALRMYIIHRNKIRFVNVFEIVHNYEFGNSDCAENFFNFTNDVVGARQLHFAAFDGAYYYCLLAQLNACIFCLLKVIHVGISFRCFIGTLSFALNVDSLSRTFAPKYYHFYVKLV